MATYVHSGVALTPAGAVGAPTRPVDEPPGAGARRRMLTWHAETPFPAASGQDITPARAVRVALGTLVAVLVVAVCVVAMLVTGLVVGTAALCAWTWSALSPAAPGWASNERLTAGTSPDTPGRAVPSATRDRRPTSASAPLRELESSNRT
jgi:hypothetical protein